MCLTFGIIWQKIEIKKIINIYLKNHVYFVTCILQRLFRFLFYTHVIHLSLISTLGRTYVSKALNVVAGMNTPLDANLLLNMSKF